METPTRDVETMSHQNEFQGMESGPTSEQPIRLSREDIVIGALEDATRGTASSLVVLETDLNNSQRLLYARRELEYDKVQMDALADDMLIGKSKSYDLWRVAEQDGYIERIWKKVAIEQDAQAKRGKAGREFRAKGWRQYYYSLLDEDRLERPKKQQGSSRNSTQAEELAVLKKKFDDLIGQRDAYKAKIDELEAEIERLHRLAYGSSDQERRPAQDVSVPRTDEQDVGAVELAIARETVADRREELPALPNGFKYLVTDEGVAVEIRTSGPGRPTTFRLGTPRAELDAWMAKKMGEKAQTEADRTDFPLA
jgi:hypothetical protein